jgi:5-methylcytosine-specific restriction enzyme A
MRAGGLCELCNEPGFVTAAGSIYLETHHVVPLADNGLDHPSNVVAICPQDHRRTHYAAERDEIAVRLTAILASFKVQ